MLINRVNDEEVNTYEKENVADDSEEYHQPANDYFGIMTKNLPNTFDVLENRSLIARDLVILYENIDLGTKLITHDDLNHKASNQYVETVIYNDDLDSEDSDVYEIYSNEDLHNVFNINHERMDFFNSMPCQNNVCQKFGNIEMKSSDLTNEYDKYFLLNDPYIKEQLRSLHVISDSKRSDSTVLPASLLDYICSKHLGDDYNFYMDSIIERVQHTIEQLKRISNGDYLTERAKERWREAENVSQIKINEKNHTLSSATNISLPIQRKICRQKNIWDVIVRSEMDVRYLTKILHKKIILAVPKMLRGSLRLLNKPFKDILSMSCKARKHVPIKDKEKLKVDHGILKLKGSVSNVEISDINSLIVVKPLPSPIINADLVVNNEINIAEYCESNVVTIRLKEFEHNKEKKVKIIELDDQGNVISPEQVSRENNSETVKESDHDDASGGNSMFDSDVHYSLSSTYELGHSMQRLNIQSPVFEEIEDFPTKKKSPTRVRIKSPYENKSHIIEENRRKKLLEIREKREKKKIAMNENCKVTKHKYVKGAVMAQSSNSVTKLSITNKSFYNSIYGQTNKTIKNVNKLQKRDISDLEIEYDADEAKNDPTILTPGQNDQKYINRSYYLDEADTEVMYLQMKPNNNGDETKEFLTSMSALSNDIGANCVLKHFISPSTTDFSGTDTSSSLQQNILNENSNQDANKENECGIYKSNAQSLVPSNTPKQKNSQFDKNKKATASVECRKSIDKIYNLMNTINVENKLEKVEIKNAIENTDLKNGSENIIVQGNDYELSIRHPLTSSIPISSTLDKAIPTKQDETKKCVNKKTSALTSVVPKIIINSKTQVGKLDIQKTKKETKKVDFKNSDNPLKAISQLLHEFDNIQKTRHKNGNESKSYRKIDNLNTEDKKAREFSFINKIPKHVEVGSSKFSRPLLSPLIASKYSQQNPRDEKPIHKKNISDMIDEAKEMRGEAVRGPSKRSSRIDNLAQPKKSYVKAHSEDFQNKCNKNPIPKVIKPVNNLQPIPEKSTRTGNCRNRLRLATETPIASSKQPYKIGASIEKFAKIKRSANSSPTEIEKRLPAPVSRSSYTYNVFNTPDPFEKKMVAVESYLKHHFGQMSPTRNQGDKHLVHVARVPLIPTDIDLASMTSSPIAEESTTLGNKLHDMIHSKITTNDLALSALTEHKESISKTDTAYEDKFESVEQLPNCGTKKSNSDYAVDIFEDKNIVTAVACVCEEDNKRKLSGDHKLDNDHKLNDDHKLDNDHKLDHDHKLADDHKLVDDHKLEDDQKLDDDHKLDLDKNSDDDGESKCEMQKCSSDNELQKLENALYHKISSGTFHKRLRIKKLTLTPKPSMQQILVLQSGDAGSLIVKSTLSQNFKFSETQTVSKFNILPVMSNDAINWNLPMQIATVGYVFPSYQSLNHKSILDNRIKFQSDSEISSSRSSVFKNKIVQCHKGQCNAYSCLNHNTNTVDDNHFTNTIMACSNKTLGRPDECIARKELFQYFINDESSQKKLNDHDNESENVEKFDSDTVSNSTSLDMLVGLLNEIKKITTCQSNLVSFRKGTDTYNDDTELKVILNKAAVHENSADNSLKTSISITSVDSLRQVHSSNFSLRIPSDSDVHEEKFVDRDLTHNLPFARPLFIDKEVNVQVSSKELVHRFTDVPSRLFPHTTNPSTDVLRSLMSVGKRTSSESICSFSSSRTQHSRSELNEITVLRFINNTNSKSEIKHREQKGVDEVINLNVTTLCTKEIDENNILKRKTCNSVAVLPEFDPMIKMKRDVLVTVYSILVITVFAALTIPEIMFYA